MHAVTQYQKAKNARISSFSFMLWWKREQDGGERRLTSCLPFDNRSIKQETCFDRRKPFTGIYLIHDPRWITWLYAGLMIALIGIFGGLAYTRSDPEPWMFLLIVAAAVVTLLYTKIWKWSTRFESELRMEF